MGGGPRGLLDVWNEDSNFKQFSRTTKLSDQLFQILKLISFPVSKKLDTKKMAWTMIC